MKYANINSYGLGRGIQVIHTIQANESLRIKKSA